MAGRDLLKLGAALTLGIAIAFPLGLMMGGRDPPPAPRPDGSAAEHRQPFSPIIANDPYFVEQQRVNIRALELRCRQTGELCGEARQARAWLEGRD